MAVTYFEIHTRGSTAAWDISDIATEIEWTTDIDFAAGELKFTLIETDEGFYPKNGDVVSFQWDGQKTFFGYVFSTSLKSSGAIEVVAYDRLRYLKNQDTIVWPVGTALQRFNSIMERLRLPHKNSSENTLDLEPEVSDGKTYFDMLKSAFDATETSSGNRYVMRDLYGTVEFVRVSTTNGAYLPLRTGLVIGDNSLLTDFTYGASIDELYNVVKLIKETEDEQKRTVYTTQTANSYESQMKYGTLQIVEKADNELNESQMYARANQLLRQYNKEKVTLTIDAIGDLTLRAGTRFYIDISALKKLGVGMREVLAAKVTHKFGADWSMTVDVEV